jgi:hypothetical protein
MARNTQSLWVHTKFGYSLPRRSGKNEVVAMQESYRAHSDESKTLKSPEAL